MNRPRFLLVLWLTGKCNLHCSYCYAGNNPAPCAMSFDTAKKAIDRLENYQLKIQFAGGEPLLNFPLAEKICAYVQEQKLDAVFRMQTNGTLITPQIAQRLRQLHIAVGVSLDGPPQINRLTRGNTLEAVNGIRMLAQEGMMIGLNAVVTSKNVEHLDKLMDFAFYLGSVGGIGLDLLRHAGRGEQNKTELDVSSNQLQQGLVKMYERSRELYRISGRKIEIREIDLAKKRLHHKGQNRHYCYASCGRSVVVLPDGSTYPCGSLISPEYAMGKAENLNPEHLLHLETKTGAGCSECPYEEYCPKGCPSRKICNENDLDCVLLKTAFALAEREQDENNHQYDSCRFGYDEIC